MTNILRKKFRYTFFNATLALIAINVLVFLATSANVKLHYYFGMNPVLVVYKKMYWQLFTYTFIHADWSHLFYNMIGLLFFGISVEKAVGSKEFLLLYFLCGIFAGACSLGYYLISNQYNTFLIGASGAVFAILFAYAVIFPNSRIFIFGLIPVPGPILILIYAIIEFGSWFFGVGGNVAHFTHLFGFGGAWAYFLIRMGVNPIKVWKNALR